jgi:hypothetical protein
MTRVYWEGYYNLQYMKQIEGFFFGFLNFLKHITGGSQQNQTTAQHWNWLPIDPPSSVQMGPFCCCWPLCGSLSILVENPHPKFSMKIWMSVPIDPNPFTFQRGRVSRSTTEHISVSDSLVAFGMWTQIVELGLGIPKVSKIAQILPINK